MPQGPPTGDEPNHERPPANTRPEADPAGSTTDGEADAELTMIIAQPATRQRLQEWKRQHDYTYDEAITHLLDAAPDAEEVNPDNPETTLPSTLDTDGGEYVNIAASVGVRNRLKLWKTYHDYTYDEALRALLDTYTGTARDA